MNYIVLENLKKYQSQLSVQKYSDTLNKLESIQFQQYLCSAAFFSLWTSDNQEKRLAFIQTFIQKEKIELINLGFFMQSLLSICKESIVCTVYKELLDTIDCNLILH